MFFVAENCRVKRLKRKSGKSHVPDIEQDFQAYLENLKNTHQLEYDDGFVREKLEINDERFMKKMHEKWNEHKGNCYLVEVLTGFQASIQSICENLILLDRVVFFKGKGFPVLRSESD
ncbi:hypothetical protein NQ314_003608 [Rhamnusium bicolor]|uniref:Uncharacterized protein n=1 Tax=Rhamnusium bicolor TaxID=1586634 RepID=A0AAV8ZNC7_9CUCU|nr:hypothetical protein NQ314_003608 [Rhamnusium bicolor]